MADLQVHKFYHQLRDPSMGNHHYLLEKVTSSDQLCDEVLTPFPPPELSSRLNKERNDHHEGPSGESASSEATSFIDVPTKYPIPLVFASLVSAKAHFALSTEELAHAQRQAFIKFSRGAFRYDAQFTRSS